MAADMDSFYAERGWKRSEIFGWIGPGLTEAKLLSIECDVQRAMREQAEKALRKAEREIRRLRRQIPAPEAVA